MIPWGKLLRSVPVWASAVATMGNQWGDATLALGMTKYLKLIYGFSTANVSWLRLFLFTIILILKISHKYSNEKSARNIKTKERYKMKKRYKL